MKRKIICGTLFFISLICIAQENNNFSIKDDIVTYKENEISLNLFSLVAIYAVDISYERILDLNNSVGINIYMKSSYDNSINNREFSIGPYYRKYFFNKKKYGANGFFMEASSYYAKLEYYELGYDSYSDPQGSVNSLTISSGLGWKWGRIKGFSVETFIGYSKYFTQKDNYYLNGLAKIGVTIGKRF